MFTWLVKIIIRRRRNIDYLFPRCTLLIHPVLGILHTLTNPSADINMVEVSRLGVQKFVCSQAADRNFCVSSISMTAPPAPSTERCVTTTLSLICNGGWRGAV